MRLGYVVAGAAFVALALVIAIVFDSPTSVLLLTALAIGAAAVAVLVDRRSA